MDPVIYLEPDEEITSVVEKLKRSKSPVVGIVAPRNAVLLQSVVNLKLLKRQAAVLKKEISLVTGDRIGQNLALRTGLTVYANVHDTEPLNPPKEPRPDSFVEDEQKPLLINLNNYKVHRYDEKNDIVDATARDEDTQVEDEVKASNFQSRPINQSKPESPKIIPNEELDDEILEEDEAEYDGESSVESVEKVTQPESKLPDHPQIQPKKIEELSAKKNFSPIKVSKSKSNYLKIALVFGVFIVIAGLICVLALNSITKGSVIITVASESVKQDITFQVSKDRSDIDSVKNILPGRLIESEQSATQKFKATGTKDIGEKATGKMTVTNQTGNDVSFEANTAFKTAIGIIFRSNKAFTVPAATPVADKWDATQGKWIHQANKNGSVIIDVTANEAGDKYNITPTNYTISTYTLIQGQGGEMAGGATKEVTIVSKDDIDKATTAITNDLTDKSLAEVKKKSGSAIYLEKAVKTQVVDATSDIEVNSEATEFDLTAKVKSSVLVFDKSKLDTLIEDNLKSKIAEDKTLVASDTKDLNLVVVSSEPEAGIMKLSASVSGKIIPKLDKTKIGSDLAGKSPAEVASYFQGKDDIASVQTKLEPSWWAKKMPATKRKISIEIKTQN